MNDILNILKRGGLKELKSFNMNFIKKYKCSKCGHSFPKITTGNFIKGTMPQCPICGGNETETDNKVEKKKEK